MLDVPDSGGSVRQESEELVMDEDSCGSGGKSAPQPPGNTQIAKTGRQDFVIYYSNICILHVIYYIY